MKRLAGTVVLAAVLWTMMFSPWTAPKVNFWAMMTLSAVTLAALATCFRPRWWREVPVRWIDLPLGTVIAAALWGLFWVGDKVSTWMFDFARPEVNAIYGMKEGFSPWVLAGLMILLIGPAEEIFWRGYVQRTLTERYGGNMALAATTAVYALVHAGSCNVMLTLAAMVAGAAWGVLYRFCPDRFGAIILSHALWDTAVFILFPI